MPAKLWFLKGFYLLLERREGREKERERNINAWLPFLHPLHWGPGPQPRHVPWLEIEPATLWFTGQHSILWATPVRANVWFLSLCSCLYQQKILFSTYIGINKIINEITCRKIKRQVQWYIIYQNYMKIIIMWIIYFVSFRHRDTLRMHILRSF